MEGLFIYKNYKSGEESLKAFFKDWNFKNNDVFDDLIGSYRINIKNKENGYEIFFGDNSGMMTWYYNIKTGEFNSKFNKFEYENIRPNYEAITEFLYFGCIYSYDSIVDDIYSSNPNNYYIVKENKVYEESKKLTPMKDLNSKWNELESILKIVINAIDEEILSNFTEVITGGMDSRTILAILLYNDISPSLTITGGEDHVDVILAEKIADKTNLKLEYFSDKPESIDWIKETKLNLAGRTGICGTYRLLKQARGLAQNGVKIKTGGVAGEMYKNSFINQDFPKYWGKPNWDKFLKYKVITYLFPEKLLGNCTEDYGRNMNLHLVDVLNMNEDINNIDKVSGYLNVGYKIMQRRVNAISNMENEYLISYNPLLERKVAAIAYNYSPFKLEMQSWQRSMVSKFAPSIMNIETDRGLTCNYKRRCSEFFKSIIFLGKIFINRTFNRNKSSGRIDDCFEEGLTSTDYYNAVEKCKELKLINSDINANDIPKVIADRVFSIGVFFIENDKE